MPEAGPEVGPEIGAPGGEEKRILTPKEKALRGLKEAFSRLKEKGVSLPAFRKRLEAQARGEEEKDPDIKKAVSEIDSLVKAEQKEKRELTDVEKVREAIEALSRDPSLSPEERERVEGEKTRLADFEAKEMMGEISADPEKRAEQLDRILAGVEGVRLARAVAEVAAEKKPYPTPKPLRIGGGEKGWMGKGRLAWGMIAVPLVVTASCVLGGVYLRKFGEAVSPEGYEEATGKKREETRTQTAEALIEGRHPYSAVKIMEQQGEYGKELAKNLLEVTRDKIVKGEHELGDIRDPELIARLIYDYPGNFPKDSSLSQIEDLGKRRQVEEFLDEFEEKETGETGYKPSLRETAKARAKQRSVSAQARVSKRTLSRRERGLT